MKKYMMILLALVVGASGAVAGQSLFDGMSKEELDQYEIVILKKAKNCTPESCVSKVVGRMSRAEYKVVKIGSEQEVHPNVKLAAQKLIQNLENNAEIARKYNDGYTTVILHGGVGNDGLKVNHSPSAYEVTEEKKAVGGVTACRSAQGKGICASGFTNELITLGLKFDF